MNTERWQRVGDIFERLLEVPEGEREKRLASLCGDDQQLRGIVVSMLDSHESPARFSDASLNTLRDSSQAAAATSLRGEPPPRDTETEGTRIGPWRLARRIGAGGMGVVWLAERADGQFRQRAALKLIKRGMDSEAVLARFLRERQILARLEHRNIAHLLDGGIAPDGRPYFAMEYVEGLPLLAYCNEHHLKLEERLRLFLQVCTALRFAHAQHVVHRDIKPSNILVTADGSVKLLDFGIAKLLQGDDELTSTLTGTQREQPMTPAYAAPEQIAGGEVTEATDVYALGVVFYELLSGRRPHDFSAAADAHDVLKIILATDPVAPGRLKLASSPVPLKRLRGDLDTIALTALRQLPTRRYPSVAAFAADIENYLAGRPIAAKRDHIAYRSYKFFRRHRSGSSAILAVVLLAALAMLLVWRERQARGFIGETASVAIFDLTNLSNRAEDVWIGPTLGEQLTSELAVSGKLRTLPGEVLQYSQTGLPPPSKGGYSTESLATLRKRLDVDYVLSGSYLVSGTGRDASLRLDIAVQDARNAMVRAAISQEGNLADVPRLIERAGVELRERLGVQDVTPKQLREIARGRPSTLELTRSLGNALDALRKSEFDRARSELLDARTLAPDYAPVYVYLAQAYKALGYDAKALAAAEQAEARSEGLPQEQRLQIAHEVAVQKSDWPRVLDIDTQLLALDGKNREVRLVQIKDLNSAGKYDQAAAALAELRKLPGSEDDPSVDLLAAKIASERQDSTAHAAFAERALKKAQGRDELAAAADAKFELADAKNDLGEKDAARKLFEEVVSDAQRISNPHLEGKAHVMLGIIGDAQSNPKIAQKEYEKAQEISLRTGERILGGTVYANLMNTFWNQGDRDAAETAAAKALAIWRETGNVRREAQTLSSIAFMKLDEAAADDALEGLRHAVDLNERAGDRAQYAYSLNNYMVGLLLRGEVAEAKKTCERAQDATKQLPPYFKMVVEFQCAQVILTSGDIARATAAFTRAQGFAAIADAKYVSIVDVAIAQIDMANGKWEQARDRLSRAADQLATSEAVPDEANGRALLALCYQALDNNADRDRESERARQLRSRTTQRQEAFVVDVAQAQLKGLMGQRDSSISALLNLADDAERRQWISSALEAQLAAFQLLESYDMGAAAKVRSKIETVATQHGFGWVLLRLKIYAAKKSHLARR